VANELEALHIEVMVDMSKINIFWATVILPSKKCSWSTYFVDPRETFLSENLVLTLSPPLHLTHNFSLKSEGNDS